MAENMLDASDAARLTLVTVRYLWALEMRIFRNHKLCTALHCSALLCSPLLSTALQWKPQRSQNKKQNKFVSFF
jgi:hypothetical protein